MGKDPAYNEFVQKRPKTVVKARVDIEKELAESKEWIMKFREKLDQTKSKIDEMRRLNGEGEFRFESSSVVRVDDSIQYGKDFSNKITKNNMNEFDEYLEINLDQNGTGSLFPVFIENSKLETMEDFHNDRKKELEKTEGESTAENDSIDDTEDVREVKSSSSLSEVDGDVVQSLVTEAVENNSSTG